MTAATSSAVSLAVHFLPSTESKEVDNTIVRFVLFDAIRAHVYTGIQLAERSAAQFAAVSFSPNANSAFKSDSIRTD